MRIICLFLPKDDSLLLDVIKNRYNFFLNLKWKNVILFIKYIHDIEIAFHLYKFLKLELFMIKDYFCGSLLY